jgi:magnesium transporter
VSIQRAIAQIGDAPPHEVECTDVRELLHDERARIWLDIEAPGPDDIALLRDAFNFHELALEDALRRKQRPKVDEYGDFYFIVLYAAASTRERPILTHEVHCFWGRNYVVTLHEVPMPEIKAAVARWIAADAHHDLGVAYQVYALFDAILDGYFPAVDELADRIEDLEQDVFDGAPGVIEAVFSMRRQLLDARRVLGPTRDVLNVLIRRDVPIFPTELVPYLADVYDHSIRVIDTLDLQRDLLSSAVDSYLSITSNRLNQSVRTMTALTIGLMVPAFIPAIYGMNFHYLPELDFQYGYPLALLGMLVSTVVILFVFRRVGWLGGTGGVPSRPSERDDE